MSVHWSAVKEAFGVGVFLGELKFSEGGAGGAFKDTLYRGNMRCERLIRHARRTIKKPNNQYL